MGSYSYKDESSPQNIKIAYNLTNNNFNDYKLDSQDKYFTTEKTRAVTDDQAIMRQSLKVLYKNNFVALTFEDLNAYIIQVYYRLHLISKSKVKRRGIIEVIYTPYGLTVNTKSKTEALFLCLDVKKYRYRSYDLTVYKNLIKFVDKFGGKDNLPMVFINGYYIGGKDKFLELEDLCIISHLVNKEYEKRCLSCNILRISKDSNICTYCFSNYLYFAVSETVFDVYGSRWDDKKNTT